MNHLIHPIEKDECDEGLGQTTKVRRIKGYYKVPFRRVYCETIRQWLASIVLCFVVYKLDPPKLPDIG